MVYGRAKRIRGWTWVALLALLALFFGSGCGGASQAKYSAGAASPGSEATESAPMPAEPMADGVAADEDPSAGEAREEVLYRNAPGPVPGRATAGVAQATPPPVQKPVPVKKEAEKPDAASVTPSQALTGVATPSGEKPSVAAPMLIYKAQLYMAVFETRKAIDAVEKLAKDQGGYLVSREDNKITVRVPSGKFDGAVAQIAKLGDLLHRNVSVQDVTDEYFDLQIRLRNLEVMRDRLEELLKKAAKVEEALAVERELERVAGEIERLKGRLKLLHELVTFSTITVEFQPRPTDHVQSQVHLPFPWLDKLGLGELLRL
jgi:Domain of unknown function (DUF4349)